VYHYCRARIYYNNLYKRYNVLYEISNRNNSEISEKITTPPPPPTATHDDRLVDTITTSTSPTSPTNDKKRKENMIPTNQNVWPILIHNVQQRLLEGITTNTTAINAAAATTTMTATTATVNNSGGNSNSCTNNAIYQILRNGPVLFNHV